ncbi:MAG: FAD-dependent oxidoreductase [Oscillospiraceae bacterium]|jgi:hypothetical protein|nr:FAD-dependent oxidoreductase [Oscillospiraceae bacterium]
MGENENIFEPERSIKVSAACDVLVAGGGIAGIAAAIAAARGGRRVMLIEREYTLGGMATLGLVTIYLPLCDGDGNQLIYGIGEELLKLSIKHGAEANYPHAWLHGGSVEERIKHRYIAQFNPHLFALNVEALLLDLGVTILYGTLACAVKKEGDMITHVVFENKSGRSAVSAQSVIDCTGDADICHLAGAKTAKHAKGNGLASWYYYYASGAVKLKMFGLADLPPSKLKAKDADPYDNVKVTSLADTRFSGVDGAELSDAVAEAHRKMYDDIVKFREEDESYVPVTISTIPLVRMSRRLVGAYTMDDTENKVFMKDSIGMTGDWRKRGYAYELPFGTLHGKEVKNLLAAGRDISITDAMWDITRVIPPCAVTGEAAGTAAALGSDFTETNIPELQERLSANNVKLHL